MRRLLTVFLTAALASGALVVLWPGAAAQAQTLFIALLRVGSPGAPVAVGHTNGNLHMVPYTDSGDAVTLTAGASSSATLSNVNDTNTNATLSAANGDRIGWRIVNDSTQSLYVKFGATATTTSYSVKLGPGDYYNMELPIYTGIIDGIWAADASGAARITEVTQ